MEEMIGSDKIPFTIAIDFDGVISDYSEFLGKGIFAKPVEGVISALHAFKDNGCRIIIHTTRSEVPDVAEYLEIHGIPYNFINFNPANKELGLSSKPLAHVYIDDRAVTFPGKWDEDFVSKVLKFKPHYEIRRERETPEESCSYLGSDTVPDRLNAAADLFRERDTLYGEAYIEHGKIMKALFPDGVKLNSVEDFNRFGILNMMVSKLNRYSNNFDEGGHEDSIRDLGVYSFMLERVDDIRKKN